MNRCLFVAGWLATMPALARPVDIDLTVEKAVYERKAGPRKVAIAFLVPALTAVGVSVFGYAIAANARGALDAQQLPVDRAARVDLIAAGDRGNVMGLVGALIAIGLGTVSAILFARSF